MLNQHFEFLFYFSVFLPNAEMMDQHFEFFLPDDLNATDAKKKEFSEMVRKFYLDGKSLTVDQKAPFTMVFIEEKLIFTEKINST